jgi:hypothetical protein
MQQTLFNLGPDTAGQQAGEVFLHDGKEYLAILAPSAGIRVAFRPLRHRPRHGEFRAAYFTFVDINQARIDAEWQRRRQTAQE